MDAERQNHPSEWLAIREFPRLRRSRSFEMLKALSPRNIFSGFTANASDQATTAPPALAVNTLVAGMDISRWTTVVVDNVAPGPLGILLDGNYQDAAVLDDFAPVGASHGKGAVEADGRVIPGSVLIGVNEFDLLALRMSLLEVGQVLRDTGHLVRQLRFKVPSSSPLEMSRSVTSMSDADTRVLLNGNSSSSQSPTAEKGAWSFKELVSPSGSNPVSFDDLHKMPQPEQPVESPTIGDLRLPSPVAEPSKQLTVMVPPGPIGLNLDGSIVDRAVVLGFLPLPDGSKGVLEQRGDIHAGSVLIAINGFDVTRLTLDETRSRLGALAGLERELVFQLADPVPVTVISPSKNERMAAFQRLSDLDKRRKLELSLVLKHDKTKLKRKECWFLIDAQWMARWIAFTLRNGPLPGPISNDVLLVPDWDARRRGAATGRPDEPRPGLERPKDYRCVSPMVWSLFVELHGVGKVPVLGRYLLDLYAEPLAESEVNSILLEPRLKASSLVNDLRERFPSVFDEHAS
ncbi:hypothetical protein Poli38472_010400 [Pythium oligandrum]|uniref:DUSP domain-containing protein n=1 Tax=Pythium oligandrum TaxID=41045 RepID=A0A8K1C308_PYTOL|nr:hypothetical protein Poli38472_010400 [Pythium oligandrum]|eukprot:TMW55518.1 hypothetical protein Poli38472_010400 [Pythium oligandrum]